MKVLVYHPTGNQNVRALLNGLLRHNMLHSFHTTVAVFKKDWYYSLLKSKLALLKRRTYSDSLKHYTYTYPIEEMLMFGGFKKFKKKELTPQYIDLIISQKVVKFINKHHNEIDAVYCYPGHSAKIMQTAHKYNIPCIYEITTAYYKDIQEINKIEERINPKWYNVITLAKDSNLWGSEIDKELKLADTIVCASSYIKSTLQRYSLRSSKDIRVIPYGYPPIHAKAYRTSKPLKLLYVGNLTQSKGLSYLFKAVNKLNDKIQLSLIGKGILLTGDYHKYLEKYNYLGNRSHDEVLEEMSKADIFVFPTLSDGFGMVVTESMSVGTPVIATENSCGRDIIKTYKNGWLVPIQDSDAIYNILNNLLEHPEDIEHVGLNALKTASMRPWTKYQDEIAHFILNFVNNKS